jgi:hypothetical protein
LRRDTSSSGNVDRFFSTLEGVQVRYRVSCS